jgi:hypothetical protein
MNTVLSKRSSVTHGTAGFAAIQTGCHRTSNNVQGLIDSQKWRAGATFMTKKTYSSNDYLLVCLGVCLGVK